MTSTCKTLILIIMMSVMGACGTDDDINIRLCFIGDSLVAGWDVKHCFPSWIAVNDGLISSGVAYLEAQHGAYSGQNVVVLSGTNDLGLIAHDDEQAYIDRYMSAIKNLGANQTYLLSILPRDDDWSHAEEKISNKRIRAFNDRIKALCDDVPQITYVDAFDVMLLGNTLNPAYTYDGLHLTTEGYEVLSSKLKEYL